MDFMDELNIVIDMRRFHWIVILTIHLLKLNFEGNVTISNGDINSQLINEII